MSLAEYERKRRFDATPEPPPKLETKSGHRFVVQKHRASHLHYDFRLELDGVLKSWAVPKGPSLDPADKRLAMQVEDHPVSYYDFEGNIPADNYGAGSVMVWDLGTWQALSPVAVEGKYVPTSDQEARAMLAKGDLKFRLHGKRLKGDFALVKMRGRRPGSKGNEWLLLKKHDEHEAEDYDIDHYDSSVLTKRSMDEIAGDEASAEWQSRPAGRGRLRAAWLADAIAKFDKRKAAEKKAEARDQESLPTQPQASAEGKKKEENGQKVRVAVNVTVRRDPPPSRKNSNARSGSKPTADSDFESASPSAVVKPPSPPSLRPFSAASPVAALPTNLPGAIRGPMPAAIHPMLATSIDTPFDSPDWLFEIKWDGYRAIAFLEHGRVRLVSRNQNDLTAQYEDLHDLPRFVKARSAILDGEIVALDENGRSSFSLMQQRTGFRERGRRVAAKPEVPVLYYVFDLLYLDGYDLRRIPLGQRKETLSSILVIPNDTVRFSEHFVANGNALFNVARQKGLEGILAKRCASFYEERRSREWAKIKITHHLEAVVGGYTEPEGSRQHFGSIVLGLYNKQGHLVHVGQAGSGFDQKTLAALWRLLKPLERKANPFQGKVEALKKVHWVKPRLVAEIEFSEWTHPTEEGGPKLRAPVFVGLRDDKDPSECLLEQEG